MHKTKLWTVLLLSTVACSAALAGKNTTHRGRTRPCPECSIPQADYQHRPRSPSVISDSRTAILLKSVAAATEATIEELEKAAGPGNVEVVTQRSLEQSRTKVEKIIEGLVRQEQIRGAAEETEQQFEDSSERIDNLIEEFERRSGRTTEAADMSRRLKEILSESNDKVQDVVRNLERKAEGAAVDEATEELIQKPAAEIEALIDDLPRSLRTRFQNLPPLSDIQRRQPKVDLYQLGQSKLQIEQCSISQVALQLQDDGGWVFSCRADQNPGGLDPNSLSVYNPRLYVKRNQFVVKLRCLGVFRNFASETAKATGKPVLAELGPIEVWVERGQPRFVREAGASRFVAEHFSEIDRVELEFFYR